MDRESVVARFRERFGRDPELVAVAPGRTNLIGEHTDYNGGFVFPAAINRLVWVAASRALVTTELFSIELGEGGRFHAASVEPPAGANWSKYAAGMSWVLRVKAPVSDLMAVVASDLPIASGVSSSAAIEMAFGAVWNVIDRLEFTNMDLALLGQRCENQFIGVQSGIMDQMASAMGRGGSAMLLDTRSLEIEYVAIPDHLAIALCDTKMSRELAGSAYNERRSQCEEACRVLGVKQLRDATLASVEVTQSRMGDTVFRRARHVVTENARCLAFVDALQSGREDEMGRLMRESHKSLRDDYEVSSPELDTMAEIAGQAPGCVGARMTGAGFGGACVALVARSRATEFKSAVEAGFESKVGRSGEVLICEAADGAHILP